MNAFITILIIGAVIYLFGSLLFHKNSWDSSISVNTQITFGDGETYEIDTDNSLDSILSRKDDTIHRRSKVQTIIPLHKDQTDDWGEYEPYGVVVDVETTGLINYDGPPTKKALREFPDAFPRIVEFSWILFFTNADRSNYSFGEGKSYIIKQEREIPEKSVAIHKISTELSQQVGRNIDDVLKEFNEDIVDCGYLIGHNVMFDKSVIESEFLRAGLKRPFTGYRTKDTMTLTRPMLDRNRPSLAYAKEKILPKNINQMLEGHVALDDCIASGLLFMILLKTNKQ